MRTRKKTGTLGVTLLAIALLVALGHAEERPAQTRIDLFDARSNRAGYAIVDEKTGRVDTFDRNSRRTGYGVIDSSGRIDAFDARGNRVGYGTTTPGSTPPGGRR
jgi:hypothetical protein